MRASFRSLNRPKKAKNRLVARETDLVSSRHGDITVTSHEHRDSPLSARRTYSNGSAARKSTANHVLKYLARISLRSVTYRTSSSSVGTQSAVKNPMMRSIQKYTSTKNSRMYHPPYAVHPNASRYGTANVTYARTKIWTRSHPRRNQWEGCKTQGETSPDLVTSATIVSLCGTASLEDALSPRRAASVAGSPRARRRGGVFTNADSSERTEPASTSSSSSLERASRGGGAGGESRAEPPGTGRPVEDISRTPGWVAVSKLGGGPGGGGVPIDRTRRRSLFS